ncbi:MAG TPA: glutathione S-transferase [Burkholderiaceae bacterium]|nr:glutathione S-transferase [Burkholderiaceae bacterium]
MQLIGMLDSPYVRRVAVSLQLLGIPFQHRSISVFRTFDQFRQINPVVKAPSLVCDSGTVLMDSSLILEYAESLPRRGRSLMPSGITEKEQSLRVIGLALAACEKSVQIIYEHDLRPADKRHEPWLSRVTTQLLAAYAALEQELTRAPLQARSDSMSQAGVTAAVAWNFTQATLPEVVAASAFPALARFSAAAEQLPEFRAAPHGIDTYPHPG